MEAAKAGRERSRPLRRMNFYLKKLIAMFLNIVFPPADWDLVKEQIMMEALRAKFSQHSDIREILLGTGTD